MLRLLLVRCATLGPISLLFLGFPLGAHAFEETCTLPAGSYEWTAPCGVSAGSIQGCSCDPADPDRWLIPAGAYVRCSPGGSVEFGHAAAEILIDAGGSLALEQSCTLGVPGGGLRVDGSFSIQGKVLTFGDSTPAFSADALAESTDPTLNTTVRIDEVVHCPGSDDGSALREDCEGTAVLSPGSRREVALCFPEDAFHSSWLAQIRAGDVLAFWDPTQGVDPPRDVNAFYRIEGVQPRCLIANVLQGGDSAGYGVAKREIRELQLSADYRAEERSMSVGTAGITADKQGVARWLTCHAAEPLPDGSETFDAHTQKITEVVDDPAGDTLKLLPGGFPADLPLGTHCYVDYGWMSGDAVSVWRPAVLADSTPSAPGDSEIHCNAGAGCDFDFALLANRGRVLLFPSSDIDNSWLMDAAATSDIVVLHLIDWTGANVSERVQMTSHAMASAHSVAIDGEGFEGGTLVDWHLRHSEDDYFVANSRAEPITDQSLVLRRLRVGYMGCSGGSCSIIDASSSEGSGKRAFHVDLDGLLAEDPGGEARVASSFYQGRGGIWTLRNMALIAGEHALVEDYAPPHASEQNTIFDNVYDVGRDVGVFSTEILGAIRTLSNVSLIDTRMPRPSAMLRWKWTFGARWERILVLDPRNNHPALLTIRDVGAPVVIRDLAIVGFDRAVGSGGTALEIRPLAGETDLARLSELTLALRPGARGLQSSAIVLSGDDAAFDSHRTLNGLLVANFAAQQAGSPATMLSSEDLDGVSDVCMQGNEVDGSPFPQEQIGGTVLRNAGLDFADPLRGAFRLEPGSPGYGTCGARAPGASDMWALRVLHHDPYRYGDSWKAGPCGDGFLDPGEGCDVQQDGCTADCEADLDLDGAADAIDNCPWQENPGQEDRDLDWLGDVCDLCPDFASTDNRDTDGNGIGDVCECGDANGDGRVSVFDVIAVNRAIFDPAHAPALCDTNYDQVCDISDIFGVKRKIFGDPAYCSAYPPPE